MADLLMEQAREIYLTIRALQEKMVRIKHERVSPQGVEVELTLPQFHTLKAVQSRGKVTITELAEVLGVSAPSASAMVDRLVDCQMLMREQSMQDRRRVEVALSETARQRIASMEEFILRELIDLLKAIGPEWAAQWQEVYARIREVTLGTREIVPPPVEHAED